MTAYVRTVCRELDTLRFSEWSEAVEWQTRYEGITPPGREERLSEGVRLMPNPAQEGVTVLSNYRMEAVDIYHSNGKKIVSTTPQSYAARFGVADWPKGVYIVVVHTILGDVTKKLVVE